VRRSRTSSLSTKTPSTPIITTTSTT
jgi:hypothetical protein